LCALSLVLLLACTRTGNVNSIYFLDVEVYELGPSEEAIKMPKPDERNSRTAAKKSGLVKTPQQQSAFAAQNLEDMVMYSVEKVSINQRDVMEMRMFVTETIIFQK
jgi:hypothetical protein